MNSNPQVIRVNGHILSGSIVDLSDLDFSCVNIKCYNVASNEFLLLSKEFKPKNGNEYSLFDCITRGAEQISDELKYIHILLPKDFTKPVLSDSYSKCIELFKIMFLADLECEAIAEFDLSNDENLEWLVTYFYKERHCTPNYDKFFIYPYNSNKDKVNEFIALYFKRAEGLKYVKIAVEAFLASFNKIPLSMSFISLCIAMETIIDGKTEITYKIKRTVGLLCADSLTDAKTIFSNVGEIYALRSTIVHGGIYKVSQIIDYLPYTLNLVSSMIVKLIYLNEPNASTLQEKLTFAGFSDINNVFQNQSTKTLNLISRYKIVQNLKKEKA